MRKLLPLFIAVGLAGCGSASIHAPAGKVVAVGAENQYANVISQVGGKYVAVTAIENDPNTDPHAYEASPSTAQVVSAARLVVENGLGYDTYMNRIEAASPDSSRKVIDVQHLLGVPDSEPNPHLWYKPGAMAAVADRIAVDLAAIQPAHAGYFSANAAAFDRSLRPWYQALAAFKRKFPGTAVAVTEPVGDYLLQAAGVTIRTPLAMQLDVMNGTDPAPQNISLENQLISQHRVRVLLYNEQVTDTLTQTFLNGAANARMPVVGVYETMPTGYTYQGWMLAEARALERAVADHVSTERL
jgi:zinc/manganese transport system substrate-binding protein